MEKAKAAVTDFMSKSGKHDTTVHEVVAPAVQEEVIKPHHHENVTTAVDKEIHQDHYHTTVQPIKDREVLPEQHKANLGAVQHREIDHRDQEAVKRNLAAEQSQFKDKSVVEMTSHSQSAAAAVSGEHIHHHIHETIQPVVHKETIQPHVTHTTVPIHEVHHNAAQHHSSTQLPTMTMEDFKKKGGSLSGRKERIDGFEGQPKNIGGPIKDMMPGHHGKTSTLNSDATILKGANHGDFAGAGHHDRGVPVGGVGRGVDGVGAPTHGHKEGSLMNKLDPRTDADHDGKKGIMD